MTDEEQVDLSDLFSPGEPIWAVPCPAGTCENYTTAVDRHCEEVVDVYCMHCNITVTHNAVWFYQRRDEAKVKQAQEAHERFFRCRDHPNCTWDCSCKRVMW